MKLRDGKWIVDAAEESAKSACTELADTLPVKHIQPATEVIGLASLECLEPAQA